MKKDKKLILYRSATQFYLVIFLLIIFSPSILSMSQFTILMYVSLNISIVAMFIMHRYMRYANLKLLSGVCKVEFALTLTPAFFLIQLSTASDYSEFNLNGFILLASAFFFCFDGIQDLYSVLDSSSIFVEKSYYTIRNGEISARLKNNYKKEIVERNMSRYITNTLFSRFFIMSPILLFIIYYRSIVGKESIFYIQDHYRCIKLRKLNHN